MSNVLFLQAPIMYGRKVHRSTVVDVGTDPMAYEWLRLGVRAALENNREDARYYFVQAVRTDLDFARAWLYLGGIADDPALTLSCMQKVLQLDPDEGQARTGLLWARLQLGLPSPAPVPVPSAPPAITAKNGNGLYTLPPLAWPAPPAPARVELPALPAPAPLSPPAPRIEDAIADEDDSPALVRRGVRAGAEGNRVRARYYFLKAIAADPGNTHAWLYLGGVANDPAITLACMERVLRVEPWNREARAGADWAVRKLGISAPGAHWWR
ncbi:MAG TPA: hypothetical protein VM536_08835 [Chloroflexia bacterium]|nr:hypothetical protein [Chloroflexia bacterium]